MKNRCLNVKILDSTPDNFKVEFVDDNLVMSVPKPLFRDKVKSGYYILVDQKKV